MSKVVTKINEDYPHAEEIVLEVAETGIPSDATIIYSGRNRIATYTRFGRKLCIKSFRRNLFPNNYIYTNLRPSKARRSFDNAERLLRNGFGTPTPVGMVEIKKLGRLTASYYVCEFSEEQDIRLCFERSDSDSLIRALARVTLRLQNAGVFMKDYSSGNILFSTDGRGDYRFSFIDLNRIDFGKVSHKRRINMLSQALWRPEDISRIAKHYSQFAALNYDRTQFEALDRYVRRRRSYYRRHKLKHLFNPEKHQI